MLVLTRRAEMGDASKIRIGDDIDVTVIEIHENEVRLAVDAPKDLTVQRKEIWLQLQAGVLSADNTRS